MSVIGIHDAYNEQLKLLVLKKTIKNHRELRDVLAGVTVTQTFSMQAVTGKCMRPIPGLYSRPMHS